MKTQNNLLFTSISELEMLLKQLKENKLDNKDLSNYVTIDIDFDTNFERFRMGITGVQHSHSGNKEEVIFL